MSMILSSAEEICPNRSILSVYQVPRVLLREPMKTIESLLLLKLLVVLYVDFMLDLPPIVKSYSVSIAAFVSFARNLFDKPILIQT